MAVLQHAPAGYLLSVPLTELQITIKESCLSFLLASRKTYSGSFTLIFIHLVIDKCEALGSLPPSPPSRYPRDLRLSGRTPRNPRVAVSRSPHVSPLRAGSSAPRGAAEGRSVEGGHFFLLYLFSLFCSHPPARLSRAAAVTGETGAAPAASARCPARRIFSQLREVQTWK